MWGLSRAAGANWRRGTYGRGPDMAQNAQKNGGSAQESAVNNNLPAKGKPRGESVRVSVPGEK